MKDNYSDSTPDTDVIELFELLASIPIESPTDLLDVRQAELIKHVENVNLEKSGLGKNSLLVSKNSRLTFVMKAVLGLIITANAILAAYIVNFLVQHYSQFIEFLKRLFS